MALLLPAIAGCAAGQHYRSGQAAIERGDYLQGVADLKRASDLEPRDVRYRADWLQSREKAVGSLLNQAEVAAGNGRQDEAEKRYLAVLELEPSNARALAGIENLARKKSAEADGAAARAALQQGDPVKARQLANRALELQPDLPEARALRRELDALQASEMISGPSLSTLYKKPINLEFRDASIKMIFDALSRTTGINFIFDRDVRPELRTTVFLKQTSLEDAIDVILTTSQLDKKILNPTSVLIYPSGGNKAKEYQDLVVRAFYLASADAKQTANLLKTVLKLQNLFIDEKLNLIVLRETPETIALAEKLVALHDLEEPEVMLEVEVLEVKRTRLLDLGIKVTDQLVVSPLNITTSAGSSLVKLSELRNLDSSKLGVTLPSATLTFRKEDGDANLLANPRIRVRDREKAKILIGDKVPVVTTTATSTGFVSESVQYLDVGLKLEVEPRIYLRDEIDIRVGLEVSSLVSSVKTASGSIAYQIGNRSANSVLRLRDGETQVLAGLISDEDRSAANRIPLLGDLPLLGRLFSSQKDDRQKTEIVLSITPRLIRNIQRREPAAEMFWSGTEAVLRSKPLQLRSVDPQTASPKALSLAPPKSEESKPTDVPLDNGLKLSWAGPASIKPGERFTLDLQLSSQSALRATPLQIAFDAKRFEVLAVRDGGFFGKDAAFSQLVDVASGRISVGAAATGDSKPVEGGRGRLVSVEFKANEQSGPAEFSLIGFTPVGGSAAIAPTALPLNHVVTIQP